MRFRYISRDGRKFRIATNERGVFSHAQEFDFILCTWMACDDDMTRSLIEPDLKPLTEESTDETETASAVE